MKAKENRGGFGGKRNHGKNKGKRKLNERLLDEIAEEQRAKKTVEEEP